MRRRLLLWFPPQVLLYTCGCSHVEDATSSPHTAAPLRVSPQEILRVTAVGAGCVRRRRSDGDSGVGSWWYRRGVQRAWGRAHCTGSAGAPAVLSGTGPTAKGSRHSARHWGPGRGQGDAREWQLAQSGQASLLTRLKWESESLLKGGSYSAYLKWESEKKVTSSVPTPGAIIYVHVAAVT